MKLYKKNIMLKNFLNCDTLLCIKRFRVLDGIPFALMLNYLDIKKVPNLEENFNIESLYTFLKDTYNIEFYNAQETVEAKNASKEESKKLKYKIKYCSFIFA